jgi:hypothetical protein
MDEERGDFVERVKDERVSPGNDGRCERAQGQKVAGGEENGV